MFAAAMRGRPLLGHVAQKAASPKPFATGVRRKIPHGHFPHPPEEGDVPLPYLRRPWHAVGQDVNARVPRLEIGGWHRYLKHRATCCYSAPLHVVPHDFVVPHHLNGP